MKAEINQWLELVER